MLSISILSQKPKRLSSVGLGIFAVALGSWSPIQAQKYDTPAAANAVESFQKQGEYFGVAADGTRLGAWLVAKAGNKYEVTFLPGGLLTLPGDTNGGWDAKTRYRGAGDQALNALSSTQGYSGSVTGSGAQAAMNVTGPGNKTWVLKRVDRKSPTLGLQPKSEWNAEVWFKEKDQATLANWKSEAFVPKLTEEGFLNYGIISTKTHGQCYLHIEVRSPYCPNTDIGTQDRGNSGIYLRSNYEMQVYDSFGGDLANNYAGAIYGVKAAIVNAALPPLKFATYDCWFTPKQSNGAWPRMTLYLNGVLVQDNTEIGRDNTEAGKGANPLNDAPLFLQNHGNNVVYSNIWMVKGTNLPKPSDIPELSDAPVSLQPRLPKPLRVTRNRSNIFIFTAVDGRLVSGRELNTAHNLMGRVQW